MLERQIVRYICGRLGEIHHLQFLRVRSLEPFPRLLASADYIEIMPRAQKPAARPKHDPLHIQLHEDSVHAKHGSVSQPGKRKKSKRDKSDRESEDEVRSRKRSPPGDCNLPIDRLH
jgi:hypothetical protein